MKFDFTTYQKQALTTALPSALTMDYLAPGLIAELGEVFGKQAKAVRDGWVAARLNREVCAELGDCVWFIALIAHEYDLTPEVDRKLRRKGMNYALGTALNFYPLDDEDDFGVSQEMLTSLLMQVQAEAEAHGSTLEAVAQANLNKLADRQARGVLGGSGDCR